MPNLTTIPNLTELAEHPELAQALPSDATKALYFQCLTVLNALALPMAANGHKNGGAPPPTVQLLKNKDVAARIKKSENWVEKHWRLLPPRVSLFGHPAGWLESDIDQFIKTLPKWGTPT